MDVVRQADGVTVRIANHLDAEGGKRIGSGDAVHRRRGLLHGGDIAQRHDRGRCGPRGLPRADRHSAKVGRCVHRAENLDRHDAIAIE